MAARFVIKKGTTGKYRFSLHGTNGQIIATSEAYNSKASAKKGIESVMRNAAGAEVVDETGERGTSTKKTASARKATKRTAKKS